MTPRRLTTVRRVDRDTMELRTSDGLIWHFPIKRHANGEPVMEQINRWSVVLMGEAYCTQEARVWSQEQEL